jgi:hypothetical protein
MVFRSKNDSSGEVRNVERRASRAPLVITFVVLAVVGTAYYAYYRKQAEYYTGRNLRLLAMLTAQVEGRVDYFAGYVRAQAKPIKGVARATTGENLRGAPPGLRFGKQCAADTPASLQKLTSNRAQMRRGIEEGPRGWRLRLQAQSEETLTCASVAVEDVFRPIFARDLGSAFDVLLVANEEGTVLYSIRPPPPSSTLLGTGEEWIDEKEEAPPIAPINLTINPAIAAAATATVSTEAEKPAALNASHRRKRPNGESTAEANAQTAITERESGSPVLISNLKALQKRKGGPFSDYVAIDPASLTKATDHMTVSLGGSDYVLFTQPYTYTRVPGSISGKPGDRKGNPNEWVVCGLVSASRFRYDVSAVSASVILIAIAVVMLALCCWPYLRIALIHPSQALTITDVVLIIICTIVGAAVITLALLDAFAYRGITQTADEQLKQFSEAVNKDFVRNVTRAMDVLSVAESSTRADAEKAIQTEPAQELPAAFLHDPRIATYPYVDSIAWIDDDGKQRVRFSRIRSPTFDVSARPYFNRAKLDRTWTIPAHDGHAPTPYVLEWVRSKSTGDVRAIVAKKTEEAQKWDAYYHPEDAPRPPFTVISMATDLIDVSDAVRPPGVEMAIIDESGEVIYHSDPQRIGYENFFTETDRNRALRSAVVARRAGQMDATYWGDDESMYVRPLTGSAWTLVTFRARRLTRVLNVEATLLTLSLLLLSSAPYLIVYLVVLVLKPRYRAPRLWPDEARHGDYLRLSVILVALLLLFCLNNYALAPWASFGGILIIPLLSIVTTYLVLHRTGAPRRFALGTAVWLIVTAMLVTHMVVSEIHPQRFFTDVAPLAKAVLVLATLLVAVLTLLLIGGFKNSGRVRNALQRLQARYGYATLYRLCGMLLMIVGVVLPVIGFFTISRHVEVELLVKYSQLRAASSLEHRIDHIITLSVLPPDVPRDRKKQVYSDISRSHPEVLFGSKWTLDPSTKALPGRAIDHESDSCNDRDDAERNWTIPSWASSFLPSLYEDSIAIRPLFAGASDDKFWHWCVSEREHLIKLVRKVQFDSDIAPFLWDETDLKDLGARIVIVSHLPHVSFWKTSEEYQHDAVGDETESANPLHLVPMALMALPLLGIFWFAADFVAKRLLLIDVQEPDWLARKPLSPTLGEHVFLVRRDRELDALSHGESFVDVSFAKLHQDDSWSAVLQMLDSSEAGRNVRVVDFEYGINDGAVNEKKLQWLERLLMLSDRTVIVASAVSASYIPTTPPPPSATAEETAAYFERWRALLQCFVTVTAEELDLRHEEWERRNAMRTVSQLHAAGPKTWLEKETAYNAFLRHLYNELEAETGLTNTRKERDSDTDRRRLLDELGERAETYFAGLWSSCRDDEKLLLYQLAHNGLANGRNRRTLRRLIARGLVRRNPNLELFSESFRLYVLEAAQRENVVTLAREKRGASTWDSLRLPFFVIIIAFLIMLFATQKDMMTTTTALATALTTGLPILMKLVGVFTERRADAKA